MDEPKLKAWSVTDDEYPEDVGSVLVYAATRERARYLGVAYLATDYENSCARRAKDADHLATTERVERDDRVLRKLGWREEDSEVCAACGLASYDYVDESAVCEECGNCAECGHASGEHDDGDPCSRAGHDTTTDKVG